MKRAALYLRVSTVDQHTETQGTELSQFAEQYGFGAGPFVWNVIDARREKICLVRWQCLSIRSRGPDPS
jgi:DNA invertase Pin-like site-specific DNA recombinase